MYRYRVKVFSEKWTSSRHAKRSIVSMLKVTLQPMLMVFFLASFKNFLANLFSQCYTHLKVWWAGGTYIFVNVLLCLVQFKYLFVCEFIRSMKMVLLNFAHLHARFHVRWYPSPEADDWESKILGWDKYWPSNTWKTVRFKVVVFFTLFPLFPFLHEREKRIYFKKWYFLLWLICPPMTVNTSVRFYWFFSHIHFDRWCQKRCNLYRIDMTSNGIL